MCTLPLSVCQEAKWLSNVDSYLARNIHAAVEKARSVYTQHPEMLPIREIRQAGAPRISTTRPSSARESRDGERQAKRPAVETQRTPKEQHLYRTETSFSGKSARVANPISVSRDIFEAVCGVSGREGRTRVKSRGREREGAAPTAGSVIPCFPDAIAQEQKRAAQQERERKEREAKASQQVRERKERLQREREERERDDAAAATIEKTLDPETLVAAPIWVEGQKYYRYEENPRLRWPHSSVIKPLRHTAREKVKRTKVKAHLQRIGADVTVIPLGTNEYAYLSADAKSLTLCKHRSDGVIEYSTLSAPGKVKPSPYVSLADIVKLSLEGEDIGIAYLHGSIYFCIEVFGQDAFVYRLTLDTREWSLIYMGKARGEERDGYRKLEVLGSCLYGFNHHNEIYRFDTERPMEGWTTIPDICTVDDVLYIIVKELEQRKDPPEQYGYTRYTPDGTFSAVEWAPNGVSLQELTSEREQAAAIQASCGGSEAEPEGAWYTGYAHTLQWSQAVGRCLIMRFEDESRKYSGRYALDTVSGEWYDLGLEPELVGTGDWKLENILPFGNGRSWLVKSPHAPNRYSFEPQLERTSTNTSLSVPLHRLQCMGLLFSDGQRLKVDPEFDMGPGTRETDEWERVLICRGARVMLKPKRDGSEVSLRIANLYPDSSQWQEVYSLKYPGLIE
ncbi:hypothetical protein KIPB_008432 [Kipferlia bialata]|uniref:Uncharacterized protein n=1 Tax=Kipferlia bialata TaxID=797122 RepID=A0A9K3D1P2_9EUKA|nr:hypothetical protein KIPB_008432 [Kipferlia bialata]|eukprot:g8432.t1